MIKLILQIIIIALATLYVIEKADARGPAGEYSALVESGKTREDFKTQEEMLKFIKDWERKHIYNIKENNKQLELHKKDN